MIHTNKNSSFRLNIFCVFITMIFRFQLCVGAKFTNVSSYSLNFVIYAINIIHKPKNPDIVGRSEKKLEQLNLQKAREYNDIRERIMGERKEEYLHWRIKLEPRLQIEISFSPITSNWSFEQVFSKRVCFFSHEITFESQTIKYIWVKSNCENISHIVWNNYCKYNPRFKLQTEHSVWNGAIPLISRYANKTV